MGNIVWLASYPKSGNTWIRAFIYNLVEKPEQKVALRRLSEYFVSEADRRWYLPLLGNRQPEDCAPEEIFALKVAAQQAIADSRPRGSVFTKTHNQFGHFNEQPLHNIRVTAAAIYIVRNPLDIVFSLADHFGIGIDAAIEFMANEETGMPSDADHVSSFLGSWSSHVASWTAQPHPAITVLRYEDMLDKPLKAFTRVAKLLGLTEDRQAISRAIEFSSFRELKNQELKEGFVERSPNSPSFFRKGRKNQWLGNLSEERARRIVERHYEQMTRFGYVPPKLRHQP